MDVTAVDSKDPKDQNASRNTIDTMADVGFHTIVG